MTFAWSLTTARPARKAPRRARRLPPPRLEALEGRLTPAVTFDPASGVLFLRADAADGNDSVAVKAAGPKADGSTGVEVFSDLTGGRAARYGDAAHPVKQLSLALGDGNDSVRVGDLASVDVLIGAGNGNNEVRVGRTAGAAFVAGSGLNRVTLGAASRDQLSVGSAYDPNSLYVGIGFGYRFDPSGGSFALTAPVGNAKANVVRLLDSPGAFGAVEINGTGSNTVATGPGLDYVAVNGAGGKGNNLITAANAGAVQVVGEGNNSIRVGDGDNSVAFVAGGGDNSVVMGDGAGDYVQIDGPGSNRVVLGDGKGDVAYVGGAANAQAGNGAGNNYVRLGDGAFDRAYVTQSNGNNTVTVGNGYRDYVQLDYWYTPGNSGTGNNTVRVGDGSRDVVQAGGTGDNTVVLGDGNGDSITFDASASSPADGTYASSRGNKRLVVGNGNGDSVALANSDGRNLIGVGNGNGDTVLVYAAHDAAWNGDPASAPHVAFRGDTTVRVGDGSGDSVVLDMDLGDNNVTLGGGDNGSVLIVGAGGTGRNVVRVGDGAGDAVTVKGGGLLAVEAGRGAGDSVRLEGAGFHAVRARHATGAAITDVGGGGGLIDAASDAAVTVNGAAVTAPGLVDGVFVRLFR